MNHKANDEWFENAARYFQEALSSNNVSLARAILLDVRDKGYNVQAWLQETKKFL